MAAKYATEESFLNTSKNKLDDLQYLLMKGFNCNEIAGENGLSLFHMVVADDCEDFALQGTQLCLNYGGNPNLRSMDGLTPTNLCCVWGRKAVFELLLNNGGDPYIKDVYGMDSRAYALKEGYLDILDTISNFESNRVSRNLGHINPNKYEFVKEWCNKCASPAADSSNISTLEKSFNQESVRSNQKFSIKLEDNNNKNVSSIMTYNETKCNETSVQTGSNDYISCQSSIGKSALTFEKSSFNQDLIITGIEPISSKVYSQIISKTNSLQSLDNYLSDTYDKSILKSHDNSFLDNHDELCIKSHANHSLDSIDEDIIKSHNSALESYADSSLENHDNHFIESIHSLESHDGPLTQLHGNSSLESITQSHDNCSLESHGESITHGNDSLESYNKPFSESHNCSLESHGKTSITELYENRYLESHKEPFSQIYKNCSFQSYDKSLTHSHNSSLELNDDHSLKSHDDSLSKLHNNSSLNLLDKPLTQSCDNFSLQSHDEPFTQTYDNRSLDSHDEPMSKLENNCTLKSLDNFSLESHDKPFTKTCDNYSLVHCIKSQDNNQYSDNQMISSLESNDESFFDANDGAILESPDNKHSSLRDFSHIDDDLSIITADNDDSEIRVNCNVTMRRYYPLYEQEEECSLLIKDFNESPPKELPETTSDNDEINVLTNAIEKLSLFPMTNTSNLQKSCENLMPVSSPSESYVAIAEEKKFLVDDIGVELVERRYLVTPCLSQSDVDETMSNVSTECSIPKSVDYDTDSLRKELKSLGINPGPITNSTKIVYIKKLLKLKKHPERLQKDNTKIVYSPELERTLKNINWTQDLKKYIQLENGLSQQFSKVNPNKVWRGGNQKTSFTYLLLDPRITNNLPARVNITTVTDSWATFIESIFYVGKGIRSRPYAHLYQAVEFWNKTSDCKKNMNDKKVRRILDIWEAGLGVICLNVFQHVIAVEAFTREAAMIDALCIKNLTNIKSGEYYGISTGWSCKEKRNLGVYLLHRAMNIFLNEGERQIHPADIK